MGKPPSEFYWEKNSYKYPYQLSVPYMSQQDPDPRHVQQKVNFDFLRVPFNGEAHWGFITQDHLDQFKKLVGIK